MDAGRVRFRAPAPAGCRGATGSDAFDASDDTRSQIVIAKPRGRSGESSQFDVELPDPGEQCGCGTCEHRLGRMRPPPPRTAQRAGSFDLIVVETMNFAARTFDHGRLAPRCRHRRHAASGVTSSGFAVFGQLRCIVETEATRERIASYRDEQVTIRVDVDNEEASGIGLLCFEPREGRGAAPDGFGDFLEAEAHLPPPKPHPSSEAREPGIGGHRPSPHQWKMVEVEGRLQGEDGP